MLQLNLLRSLRTKSYLLSNSLVGKTKQVLKSSLTLQTFNKPLNFRALFSSPHVYFSGIASMIPPSEEEYELEEDGSVKRPLISNPEQVKDRKILYDLYVEPEMKLGEFKKLLQVPEEQLEHSLRTYGVPDNPNFMIKMEDMEILALEFDAILHTKNTPRDELPLRPPVMTIMGHVDHGKTTLLDALRDSDIAGGEYGGITQKIGAFVVQTKEGKSITFIDTPGHEAFVNMRKRGSLSTDIVILVVSATDGCQPQTFEAIEHAKRAGVPIIVAINKIDRGTNPEEVEKELFKYGLNVEPCGGNVPVIHISAKFRKNIDLLEELILFEAELMDLRADHGGIVEGVVLETKRTLDTEAKTCTVIVQKGTLKVGDNIVAGTQYGRIRQMKDDRGRLITEAPPSMAVEVIGLKELPENGDVIFTVSDLDKARVVAARRKANKDALDQLNNDQPVTVGQKIKFSDWRERKKYHSGKKEAVKEILQKCETELIEKIEKLKAQEIQDNSQAQKDIEKLEADLESHYHYVKEMVEENDDDSIVNLIVKAQDKGTLETLEDQIQKVAAKQDEITFNILSSGVGNITENEIRDAKTFNAMILGMDVLCPPDLIKLAEQDAVKIKTYKIIYDILDEIKNIFKKGGLTKVEHVVHGAAAIKQIFEVKLAKGNVRKIAGVTVSKGHFTRKYKYRVSRGGKIVGDNYDISSLKHFKNEVNEVKKGKECGISLFGFEGFQEGDVVEAYELSKSPANK